MNAQQQVMKYAESKANGMDIQKFVVEMQGGIVINRTSNSKTVAQLSRVGRELVITETTTKDTQEIVDGKLVFGKAQTSVEALRVSL